MMTRSRFSILGALAFTALLATLAFSVVACVDPTDPEGDEPPYKSLALSPQDASAVIAVPLQLAALATNQDDEIENINGIVEWTSSDQTVATVSNDTLSPGLVTGLKAGTVTLTATFSETVSATATVTVSAASVTLTSIDITPEDVQVTRGGSQQYSAQGNFSDGSHQLLTESVTWSTSNPSIATISNDSGSKGLLHAVAVGGVSVTASLNSVSASTTTGVTNAPVSNILWAGTSFTEGTTNTGALNGVAFANLAMGSFVPGSFNAGIHYTIGTNLPGGLTVDVQRSSDTQLQISLNGAASTHTAVTSRGVQLNLLPAAFQNEAYPNNGSASVLLSLNFIDIGYFVLTAGRFNGNLGGIGGAQERCLADLKNNDWMGKSSVILSLTTVRAFICNNTNCSNTRAGRTYAFAMSGSPSTGGATFTTDVSGLAPMDSASWSSSDRFGNTSGEIWTGRIGGNHLFWPLAADGTANLTCQNWTSQEPITPTSPVHNGAYGNRNATNRSRWFANSELGNRSCANTMALICIVDP